MGYDGIKLHPVAGKCGVFAETDINGLQKQGVPPRRADGLAVRRDRPAEPLGAHARQHAAAGACCCSAARTPTSAGMRECWQRNIPKIWEERGVRRCPRASAPEELIQTPPRTRSTSPRSARSSSARREDDGVGRYRGLRRARTGTSTTARDEEKATARRRGGLARRTTRARGVPAAGTAAEASTPPTFDAGRRACTGFIGLDGGSTSTKAVLLSEDGATCSPRPTSSRRATRSRTRWRSSRSCATQVEPQGAHARGRSASAPPATPRTSCKDVLGADVALVETVAHTKSALHFYDDATSSATSAGRTSRSSS